MLLVYFAVTVCVTELVLARYDIDKGNLAASDREYASDQLNDGGKIMLMRITDTEDVGGPVVRRQIYEKTKLFAEKLDL